MVRKILIGLLLLCGAAQAQMPGGFEWDERATSGPMVHGKVRFAPDGSAVESYTLNGAPVSPEAARELGIRRKDWNAATADIPAALPDHAPRALPKPPHPASIRGKALVTSIDATPPAAELNSYLASAGDHAAKGVLRTGLFADLSVPVSVSGQLPSVGEWLPADGGGQVARFAIVSQGAQGIRVEFSRLLLPQGAHALVYSPDASEVFGPFNAIPADADSLWSPTVSGDTVWIDILLPAGVSAEGVAVEVRRIVHQFLDPALMAKSAGACNLDVTCYPVWAQTALGIGGLGSIGNSGSLFCTCTLLNDADPCTDTPYVLTAHHCVGTQSSASSLEFYWDFQTPSCGATAPSAASVPRTTGGADLLATTAGTGYSGGGNDFSLLLLHNDPPANLTRVGYRSSSPAMGSAVTCIHHPFGTYKRISFGTLTNLSNPYPAYFHQVTWNQGTTEPGSSGSPLMLTATQQIIGQLWGGGASCSTPTDPDYYGRFNLTYPVISSFLFTQRVVRLAAGEYVGTEGSAAITVQVELAEPATADGGSVDYSFTPGTAHPGNDFVDTTGTVSFLEGETVASFTVSLVNDTHREAEETFSVHLSNPSACLRLDTLTSSQVRIVDNDLDTDGDGISDADELSGFFGAVTNPTLVDSDADGINDLREQEVTQTNPNLSDTDNDGISDGMELAFGTDPNVASQHVLSSVRIPVFSE